MLILTKVIAVNETPRGGNVTRETIIQVLVNQLRIASKKEKAIEALAAVIDQCLFNDVVDMSRIGKTPGLFEGIVWILKTGSDAAKENAVSALGGLLANADMKGIVFENQKILKTLNTTLTPMRSARAQLVLEVLEPDSD